MAHGAEPDLPRRRVVRARCATVSRGSRATATCGAPRIDPRTSALDRLTRETIWRCRHASLAAPPRAARRARAADAVVVFTVPMAHFRGIPTALRERFGIPVVFYDGDVPMSLPEFGGMDTGFNYYHGADPSEYDLVLSNSEGGLPRLLELGARRAEAVFWGADPEFFAPQPVDEGDGRLLLRLRRQVPAGMDGGDGRRAEPRGARDRLRPRRPRLPGRHGRRAADRRRSLQRRSPGPSRRRGSTSTSRGARMRRCPAPRRAGPSSWRQPVPRSSPTRMPGSSIGSSRAPRSSSCGTRARRSPPTGSCSTIPPRRRPWAPGLVSACLTSTPTRIEPAVCSSSLGLGVASAAVA